MSEAKPIVDEGGDLRELSSHLRTVAEAVAGGVGEMLREAFAVRTSFESKVDSHDLVTEYDRLAEERIRNDLTRAVPDSSVWGEEEGLIGSGEITWYVDPIDGTNNFAAGVPFFCVSIAGLHHDRVLAGAIYDPVRDELFAADLAGATCNGTPLVASGAAEDAVAVLGTDFPSHRASVLSSNGHSDIDRFGELIRSFQTVRRLGSGALMLAYVAAGRLDATLGTTANPWDVAAGLILVEQAGGLYRPFPETEAHARRPWQAAMYVAHVQNFDFAGSCLGELSREAGR